MPHPVQIQLFVLDLHSIERIAAEHLGPNRQAVTRHGKTNDNLGKIAPMMSLTCPSLKRSQA